MHVWTNGWILHLEIPSTVKHIIYLVKYLLIIAMLRMKFFSWSHSQRCVNNIHLCSLQLLVFWITSNLKVNVKIEIKTMKSSYGNFSQIQGESLENTLIRSHLYAFEILINLNPYRELHINYHFYFVDKFYSFLKIMRNVWEDATFILKLIFYVTIVSIKILLLKIFNGNSECQNEGNLVLWFQH